MFIFHQLLFRNDIKVSLKKKYNDTYRSSKGFLSGNEWYCHQAFRALNQAAGTLLLVSIFQSEILTHIILCAVGDCSLYYLKLFRNFHYHTDLIAFCALSDILIPKF